MDTTTREPGLAETIRAFETSRADFTSHELFLYADALRRIGRCSDALAAFKQLESHDLTDQQKSCVFLSMGATLQFMGKHRAAATAFRKACRLHPDTVSFVQLAGALTAQERFQDAIKVLEDAMSREVDRGEVLFNIGVNQRALGRLEEAKASMEAALKLSPNNPHAAQSTLSGQAEAIRAFEASNTVPTTLELFRYANALRRVGRRSDALAAFPQLEARDLTDEEKWRLLLYRGRTLEDMGRYPEAEAQFREGCRLEPSTGFCVYLAGALAAQERFADAIAVLKDALSREGDRDEVLLNMGLSQRTLGRLEEAKASMEAALRLSPDYPEAQSRLEDVEAALALPIRDEDSRETND